MRPAVPKPSLTKPLRVAAGGLNIGFICVPTMPPRYVQPAPAIESNLQNSRLPAQDIAEDGHKGQITVRPVAVKAENCRAAERQDRYEASGEEQAFSGIPAL